LPQLAYLRLFSGIDDVKIDIQGISKPPGFVHYSRDTGGIRWLISSGKHMRKAVLLLAVLFAASLSTAADAAKKKAEAPKPDPAMAAQENTARFMAAAFGHAAPPAAAPAKKGKKK
jgi:hypothetical protein